MSSQLDVIRHSRHCNPSVYLPGPLRHISPAVQLTRMNVVVTTRRNPLLTPLRLISLSPWSASAHLIGCSANPHERCCRLLLFAFSIGFSHVNEAQRDSSSGSIVFLGFLGTLSFDPTGRPRLGGIRRGWPSRPSFPCISSSRSS